MEVFWKIDAGKQLNIAINPDFGQVESDELAVNFSSSETFYSDKRPFFSENHSLFDVKSDETLHHQYEANWRCARLRLQSLGAEPEACAAASTGISDIDVAPHTAGRIHRFRVSWRARVRR